MKAGTVLLTGGVDPFAAHRIGLEFKPGMTVSAMVREALAAIASKMKEPVEKLAWFFDCGVVLVNGRKWNRDLWPMMRLKPGAHIELAVPMPGKGKGGSILLVLAAVALTVITAGIAGGALAGTLGAGTLAAGSLSANLLAAGVGLVGSLALRALTPAPTVPKPGDPPRELTMAGVQGNPIARGETLARIAGRMGLSAQMLVPPFTTLESDKIYSHLMLGIDGMADVEDILVNDTPIDDIDGVEYEVAPGDGSTPDSFLSEDFTLEDGLNLAVSNYELKDEEAKFKALLDQATPANSYSKWHRLPNKKAACTRYTVRLDFPGGIVNNEGEACGVAFRLQVRLKGDVSWRSLPEINIKDVKLGGGFRQQIVLDFGGIAGGRYVIENKSINTHVAQRRCSNGQSFQFDADSYFQAITATLELANMTGYTSGAITVSASSELSGSNRAWHAADSSGGTYWSPANNSLPAWWKVDWGSGNTKSILSYTVGMNANDEFLPKSWKLQGSNDDATWTDLHTNTQPMTGTMQVDTSGAYRYHRVLFTENNGAANQQFRVNRFQFYQHNIASGITLDESTGVWNSQAGAAYSRYVNLTVDGATVYFDPADWTPGEYEIRLRRSWAYKYDLWSAGDLYDAALANGYFFDHATVSDVDQVYEDQKPIQSTVSLPVVSQFFPIRPIAEAVESRLTRIAVRVPSLVVESVSATFTGYAREHNGSNWVDEAVPSRNPAAYYRDALLLSNVNLDCLPGEVVDEESLIDFFEHCDSEGFTFDAILQGRNVAEVLMLFASVARGRPKQGGTWGIAIDHDRSAESPVALLTPENSRDLGTEIAFDQIPHGLVVSYLDEDDDWRLKDVTVYRPGYSVTTATELESLDNYVGLTTEAKAIAQATYDFRQMLYRKATYKREVGLQGLQFGIGDLVGVSDDIVARDVYWGLIKTVITSGGNVTGFEIYGTAELSKSAEAISDTEGVLGTFYAMMTRADGGTFTAQITEQADTTILTLATPVADTGQFAADLEISIGALDHETKLCVVQNVEHRGGETFLLSLVPDASEQMFA